MAGLVHRLKVQTELLEHLFARPETGVDDLDIDVRFQSGQTDQVAGQVDDLDRLAHVEHEDLAAPGQGASLDDQAGRFGDRHEIARDLRVGDRHLALLLDLLPEKRDHRAARTKDIAKAHGREGGQGVEPAQVLDGELGHALGRTHDIGRIDSLVGRDQDKTADIVAGGGDRRVIGAEDVVLDRLAGAVFHQGHMLVGGRMEDDRRLVLLHHGFETHDIPDRTDQDLEVETWAILAEQFLLQLVGIVLIDVEDDQAARFERQDLAAELRTDRAAAAGDHDHLVFQVTGNVHGIKDDFFAPEQILDLDFLDIGDAHFAVNDLRQHGQHAQGAAGFGADVDQFAHGLARSAGNRQNDLVNSVFPDGSLYGLASADDRHMVERQAVFAFIVIDQDDRPAVGARLDHLTDDLVAGITGPDDQDADLV